MFRISHDVISTESNPDLEHKITEDEAVLLGQIIDIDGAEEVLVGMSKIINGSNRIIGTHYVITDEVWETILENIKIAEGVA